MRPKYVQFTYVGSGVSPLKRGQAGPQKEKLKKVFSGVQLEVFSLDLIHLPSGPRSRSRRAHVLWSLFWEWFFSDPVRRHHAVHPVGHCAASVGLWRRPQAHRGFPPRLEIFDLEIFDLDVSLRFFSFVNCLQYRFSDEAENDVITIESMLGQKHT